jgi:hypothetical protein
MSGDQAMAHPDRPGRLLAARLLAADPDDEPRHFGDVMLTAKLLDSQMFIFNLKIKNYQDRREYATNGPQLHRK